MTTTFPIRVRRGSVVVNIFHQKSAGVFTVAYYEGRQRKRTSFGDLAKARELADKVADRLSERGDASLTLRGSELVEYCRAREFLDGIGVRLDTAASEFSQAHKILKGKATPLEAARHFATASADEITPLRTEGLVASLVNSREANHASKRHIQDLRSRLGRFATAFQCDVHTIRPAQIQDFLLGLKLSPRSMNNFRMAISNLFAHARLRGHVSQDFDPLANIPWAKEVEGEVQIYTADELKLILEHARKELVPYLTIGAFAGLRQSELSQLDWKDVKDDHILIMGGISKTKTKRQVPILGNLQEWLKPLRQPEGKVVPFKNVTNQLSRLAKDASLKWKCNGLRHSYGSYRLAMQKDAATISYEMGNSVPMVFKHYRRVVTEAEGIRWFSLHPDANSRPVFYLPSPPRLEPLEGAA